MNSRENLVGQKFGLLTVVEDTLKRSASGSIIWHCRCDCGKQIDVLSTNLVNPHTISCGCVPSNRGIKKGYVYGKWTVLEDKTHAYREMNEKWLCQCECGTVRAVHGSNLITGSSTSCGCIQLITRSFRKGKISPRKSRNGEVHGDFEIVRSTPPAVNMPQEFIGVCKNGHEILMSVHEVNRKSYHPVCWCQEDHLLKRYRLKLGLTLQQVGDEIGVTREAIRLSEKTPPGLSIEKIWQIANVLDIPPEETEAFVHKYKKRKG